MQWHPLVHNEFLGRRYLQFALAVPTSDRPGSPREKRIPADRAGERGRKCEYGRRWPKQGDCVIKRWRNAEKLGDADSLEMPVAYGAGGQKHKVSLNRFQGSEQGTKVQALPLDILDVRTVKDEKLEPGIDADGEQLMEARGI